MNRMLFFWTSFVTLALWGAMKPLPDTRPQQALANRIKDAFATTFVAQSISDLVDLSPSPRELYVAWAGCSIPGTCDVGHPIETGLTLYCRLEDVHPSCKPSDKPSGWDDTEPRRYARGTLPNLRSSHVGLFAVCAYLGSEYRRIRKRLSDLTIVSVFASLDFMDRHVKCFGASAAHVWEQSPQTIEGADKRFGQIDYLVNPPRPSWWSRELFPNDPTFFASSKHDPEPEGTECANASLTTPAEGADDSVRNPAKSAKGTEGADDLPTTPAKGKKVAKGKKAVKDSPKAPEEGSKSKNRPSQKKRRSLAKKQRERAEAEKAGNQGSSGTATDSPPEAGPSSTHRTGQRPELEPVEETAVAEDEAGDAEGSQGGRNNGPSQKTRRRLAKQSLASLNELPRFEPEDLLDGPSGTATDSPPEAGPSSLHLTGQRPDVQQVDSQETATADGGEGADKEPPGQRKNRPSQKARRRSAKRKTEDLGVEIQTVPDDPSQGPS
ncbi:hypothetical protein P170DRAFT_478638 [Aspergillus steynii IBT 23096]|uniref:Uncharacterized protein n=1 Tax=Aspergillus steynii IBT 23096 TaxID=1392250 RepID=A0A2I2FYI5_9EURO|nr:uncharacterized protein P170DRAFT_478638 [Aspergillus steynii IBT 23096]PLB45695.1 hypothetical protein P170DRAFT_478638 [Aspergillus steynii IBT 23096]